MCGYKSQCHTPNNQIISLYFLFLFVGQLILMCWSVCFCLAYYCKQNFQEWYTNVDQKEGHPIGPYSIRHTAQLTWAPGALYPRSLEIRDDWLFFLLYLYHSFYCLISDTTYIPTTHRLALWYFLLIFVFRNSFNKRLFLLSLLWYSLHVIGHNLCYLPSCFSLIFIFLHWNRWCWQSWVLL